MSISLKKINDEVVLPFKNAVKDVDTRPVRGASIFPEPYPNIFLCARKKSGKSICIQNIIKKKVGPNTKIIAFCSTANKDPAWLTIKHWCAKHGIPYMSFTSIKEGKVDILESFIHKLEEEAEESLGEEEVREKMPMDKRNMTEKQIIKAEKEKIDKMRKSMFYDDEEEEEIDEDDPYSDYEEEEDGIFSKREKPLSKAEQQLFDFFPKESILPKDKYKSPEYIIIFDDLSNELKTPSLTALLKKNRHFKSLICVSSQYLLDLPPQSLKQLDYMILFKGMSKEKLERVIRDGDINIDLPLLEKIYDNAVSEPYNFLYISTRDDTYRKNFDKQYIINK